MATGARCEVDLAVGPQDGDARTLANVRRPLEQHFFGVALAPSVGRRCEAIVRLIDLPRSLVWLDDRVGRNENQVPDAIGGQMIQGLSRVFRAEADAVDGEIPGDR